MKTKDLMDMLDNGVQPIIKFTTRISDIDGPDPDMMGKVIRYRDEDVWDRESSTIFFDIDISEFEEYNKTKAIPNWYDDKGNPTLTWFESSMYPKNGIESVCEMLVENSEPADLSLFEVFEISEYFKEYQDTGFKGTYVKFLEEKLDKLKSQE